MKYIFTTKITGLLAFVLFCFCGAPLQAQQVSAIVKGKVLDEFDHPLGEAIITSANGKNATYTNFSGEFSLSIDDNSHAVTVQKRGYLTRSVRLDNNKESFDIKLQYGVDKRDEVVQLGYTSQLRKEVSGAVSTVTGEELERAPVANLSQSLAGRLSGLTTMETYSELSRAKTSLFVRGINSMRANGPLMVIDGIPVSYHANETAEYISPSEIESISVLKDASTQALYGIQGANGVMVIKTKRGVKGPMQIKVSFDQAMQQATTRPAFISSSEYAAMRNQAAINDGYLDPSNPRPLPFTDAQVAAYKAGNNPMYLNNNWYDRYMKDLASMQRVSVNLTAGNDKAQFFSNINVMHQGGYFKTDQTKYDPNANNIWVNFRTNADMQINKYLKAFVRIAGNVKREKSPGAGNAAVYSSIFNTPASVYGPLTPVMKDSAGNVTDPGGQVVATHNNTNPTYGLLNRSGYATSTVTNINSQLGLDIDMSFLAKGLSLSGVFAYQTNAVGTLSTTQNFERWVNADSPNALVFQKYGDYRNTPLVYSKGSVDYYHLSYKTMLNYHRDLGRHSISAMGYAFYQNLTSQDVSSPGLLPYNRLSTGAEAAYGYDDRYFAKFDLGYSGSEQYARSHRYATTPAVSLAWVLSNELFLKSQQKWLSLLKVRASYGKTGNDQSGLNRYAYLNEIRQGGGGFLPYLQYNIAEYTRGNPNIEAEISTKKNLGIDIGLFNALTITADVFHERMTNMIVSATGTIPDYQGIPLNYYPPLNQGIFENEGYEISVNYNKQLSSDLSFNLGAMLSYNKNTIVDIGEASLGSDFVYPKRGTGRSVGVDWGFLVDRSNGNGFFNTQDELNNNTIDYARVGKPRLGDLKFRDLNHNGKIDDGDAVPLTQGMIPRYTYAFSGGLKYQSLELNLLFQGIADYTTFDGGLGIYGNDYDGVYGSLQRNAWTPQRYQDHGKITAPALSLGTSSSMQPSDYYVNNRAYLRLKNVALSYILPAAVARAISAERVRLVLSGQNLITWDKMRSKDFGPEGGGYNSFPVYRVYNVGVNINF